MARATTAAVVVLAAALAAASWASAGTSRITRGDATAAVGAFATGGWAIRYHQPAAAGAPGDFGDALIRPFADWDGRHYCSLDWHGFVIAEYDFGTRQYVAGELATATASFVLDGAQIAVTQSPLKRFLRFTDEAWVSQWGAVLLLAPGAHTFSVHLVDSSGPADFSVTVYMDAPGTGACVT